LPADLLRSEQLVDLGLADLHRALDVALAQALHGDFVAQVVLEIGEALAVGGEARAQLLHAHLVLAGDLRHRLLQFLVGNADAGLVGAVHLQAHHDQAFPAPAFRARQRGAAGALLGGELGGDVGDGCGRARCAGSRPR
jgi:hypothetical protein